MRIEYARVTGEMTGCGTIAIALLCLFMSLAAGTDSSGAAAEEGKNGRILLPEAIATDTSGRGYEYSSTMICDGVRIPLRWWESWASRLDRAEPHWVELRFSAPLKPRTLAIHWHTDKDGAWSSRRYKIEQWKDGAFKDVLNVTNNLPTPISLHTLDGVETERLRIWQPAGGGSEKQTNTMWIAEVEVYDCARTANDFGSEQDKAQQQKARAEARARSVGVYWRSKNGKLSGSVRTALSRMGKDVAGLFRLDERELKRCGVLVIAGVRYIPDKDDVINFIANGGCVLFLHNACGRSGGSPLPDVWEFEGMGRSELIVEDKAHPVTQGLPDRFPHSYADHACMKAGKKGKVLVTDAEGNAVVIAGQVGEGRVVAMGNYAGLKSDPNWDEVELNVDDGPETRLLTNSINWLADGASLREKWKDSSEARAWRKKDRARKKQFTDVTEACGMTYGWYAKGVAMADVDDDGDLDIYATLDDQPNRFYRNDGNCRFTQMAEQAGIGLPMDGIGCAFADLNGDACLDLFVCRLPEMGSVENDRNFLYLGDGKGRFRDATEQSGLLASDPTADCVFGDVDNDGDLDLYLVNFRAANELYLNSGDGVFTDVTSNWGLDGLGSAEVKGYGSLGSAMADLDGDGCQDLITFAGYALKVFHNENGRKFRDVTDKTGVNLDPRRCLGIALGDIDGDGDLDIYLAEHNKVLRNDGSMRFTDITPTAGVEAFGEYVGPYGPAFADIDNDGDLDLFLGTGGYVSMICLNNGDSTFSDVTATIGLDVDGVHGFNFGDLDDDGDLDFYATAWAKNDFKLLRNEQDDKNYLKVRVKGHDTNSAGIGAKISVYQESGQNKSRLLKGYREIQGGGGAMYTCPPLEQHFGLPHGRKYCVEVLFPVSGKRVVLNDVEAGQRLSIEEPK